MTNKEAAEILKTEDCDDCTFRGYSSCKLINCSVKQAHCVAIEALDNERPQGEWLEIKHRLNLLIGVLYSNQCISENDLKYIEDSIKKLMKGGAE